MVLSAHMAFECVAENIAMREEDINRLDDADDDSNTADIFYVLHASAGIIKYVVS